MCSVAVSTPVSGEKGRGAVELLSFPHASKLPGGWGGSHLERLLEGNLPHLLAWGTRCLFIWSSDVGASIPLKDLLSYVPVYMFTCVPCAQGLTQRHKSNQRWAVADKNWDLPCIEMQH